MELILTIVETAQIKIAMIDIELVKIEATKNIISDDNVVWNAQRIALEKEKAKMINVVRNANDEPNKSVY